MCKYTTPTNVSFVNNNKWTWTCPGENWWAESSQCQITLLYCGDNAPQTTKVDTIWNSEQPNEECDDTKGWCDLTVNKCKYYRATCDDVQYSNTPSSERKLYGTTITVNRVNTYPVWFALAKVYWWLWFLSNTNTSNVYNRPWDATTTITFENKSNSSISGKCDANLSLYLEWECGDKNWGSFYNKKGDMSYLKQTDRLCKEGRWEQWATYEAVPYTFNFNSDKQSHKRTWTCENEFWANPGWSDSCSAQERYCGDGKIDSNDGEECDEWSSINGTSKAKNCSSECKKVCTIACSWKKWLRSTSISTSAVSNDCLWKNTLWERISIPKVRNRRFSPWTISTDRVGIFHFECKFKDGKSCNTSFDQQNGTVTISKDSQGNYSCQ